MPDETPTPPAPARSDRGTVPRSVPVEIWAIDRGAELGGAGTLSLDEGGVAVALVGSDSGYYFPFLALDGVRVEPAPGGGDRVLLTLFLGRGDVAEVTGPLSLRAMARAAESAACALAEQTLALRALGSHRAGSARPGGPASSDHDRFFAPFLAARRAAEVAGCAVDRVDAFDAGALRRSLDATLAAFAAERFPDSPPDRRALEAELGEAAEPLEAAIDRLGAAAAAVRASADDARFARWRDWAAVVRDLFAAADAVWLAALPALGGGRAGRVSAPLWRRVLGRER